jgi:hypothetical protein
MSVKTERVGQWELVCLQILITGNPSQNLIQLIICKYTKFIRNRRDGGLIFTGLKFEGFKSTLVSEGLLASIFKFKQLLDPDFPFATNPQKYIA